MFQNHTVGIMNDTWWNQTNLISNMQLSKWCHLLTKKIGCLSLLKITTYHHLNCTISFWRCLWCGLSKLRWVDASLCSSSQVFERSLRNRYFHRNTNYWRFLWCGLCRLRRVAISIPLFKSLTEVWEIEGLGSKQIEEKVS